MTAAPVRRFARVLTPAGFRYAVEEGELWQVLEGAPWESVKPTGETVPVAQARLGVPALASKVVAVGQNYRKHAAEMGKPVPVEPLIFLKPSSALNAHESPIVMPAASQEVHHEAELALVIGKTLKGVDEAQAQAGIFALSCFNDVTARDIQKREVQHTRAKSYDTFACLGPTMVTGVDSGDLRIVARVNGVVKQDGRTADMIFPPARLVSFISYVMTLFPGDVVSTGTPSGVGAVREGDVVEIDIEGIGVLRNPVTR